MTSAKNIIIGTRNSDLALAQAHHINKLLSNHPLHKNKLFSTSIEGFTTTGDVILDKSLSDIGGKGLFTKEIEEALINDKISLGVHSMKDMPASYPEGLDILAIPKREDPRDAFISLKYKSIDDLPKNAVVGTSSTRRKAILLSIRPDLKIVNFRGNVNTRLKKIENREVDATILAVCGLERIKMERYISSIIPKNVMLPAVGQGALGVQVRTNDKFSSDLVKTLNHHNSSICIDAERAFLKEIDGSCKTPIAGYCEIKEDSLFLSVLVCSPNGEEIYKTSNNGSLKDAKEMGRDAGLEIKRNAMHILDTFQR
jgi:hydroxymethylbilane synthase